VQADQSNRMPADGDLSARPAAVGAAAFIFQGNTIRYVNPALEAMTGFTSRELLAMDFWEVIHPDHRDLVRARGLARQRGEPVPWEYEVKLLRKTGEALWVAFSAGMIEFEGQPAVLGTAVDITERKVAADRLQESERRWRALIENSSDVVLIVNPDLRLRYVGPSIERILGIRPDEMLGNDNLGRIHPDDVALVRAAYADLQLAPDRRASATYRIQHRDGSWHWFESIGTNRVADPSIRGIIVNSRDITDRVEAQTAYRSLVDYSLQGLLIWQDLRVVFANPVSAQISGFSIEELLGSSPEQLRALIHPDDQELVWARALRRVAGEPAPTRTEMRFVRRDGVVRWMETHISAIEYRGRPALQVAFVDITDRRSAEEQARQHQQHLAHVLRRRTMGEMAAVFAHEVNQPLTAIISYAKGCVNRLRTGTGGPEPVFAALEEIAAQAVRAAEVIRRLRGFVRKGELERAPRQLNELVEEVMHFVAVEAHEHGVRLQVDLAPNLPLLEVDTVQVEQVILNLLRNALEAIYEDGGDRPLLSVRTRCTQDHVELAVCDTGAGLRADVAAQVFEPFVTSKPGGLGMGLSICRSIVHAHGGRIWNAPNYDRGMTFAFALPLPSAVDQ
jgi:two-component system, LuxR family, sensor kinase FixL